MNQRKEPKPMLRWLFGPSQREQQAIELLEKIRKERMLYTRHPEYPMVKIKIGTILRNSGR